MKRTRKILLVIMFLIMMIMINIPNEVSARTLSMGDTVSISENGMSAVKDVYCVAHDKRFGGIYGMDYKFDFKVKAYVKLTGKHAEGVSVSGKTISGDNDTNAIMAAILGGPLKQGYGSYDNYSEAQLALYKYWNTWVKAVGKPYGFSTDSANDRANGSKYVQKAAQAAAEKDYEVTIYLLAPTGEGAETNVQELIAVDVPKTPDVPPTPEPPDETPQQSTLNGKITISGFVWEDIADNKTSTVNSEFDEVDQKLEGIKVHWRGPKGEEIASTETGKDGSYKFETTIELYNHPYEIKDKVKYDQINNSYIEFEYNGLKYSTVAFNGDLSNGITSKGKEDTVSRQGVDNKFDRVENRAVYDGNNAIISGLPNTQITDANYASEFAVSATTGNVVGGLLNISESNNWVNKKTVCSKHCNAKPRTHEIATIPITRNGSTVNVHIWCFGAPTFDEDPNGILTAEDYTKYSKSPIGNEFNDYEGAHYYAADETDGPAVKDCLSSTEGIVEWNIQNMNLGLVRREQSDGVVASDIEKVRVIMNNQEYTYYYKRRQQNDQNINIFDYKVQFQDRYNSAVYKRPVNPADIAYINLDTGKEMQVYVTYNIEIKNYSNTLPMRINKIVNYYDPNYEIYANGQTNSSTGAGWITSQETNNGYKIAYNDLLAGTILQPKAISEKISIEFSISQEAIKGLINKEATLNNFTEILSFTTYYGENTICAERESALTKGLVGKQYASLDNTSTPGTAIPGGTKPFEVYDSSKEGYEDDTDKAPSFVLLKDPNYKVMSGIVYEDQQTAESKSVNERLGNGIKDGSEKGVQNVKVELLNAETGEIAKLYYIQQNPDGTSGAMSKDAVTYTDANGNYTFGNQGECGIIADNYIVKYTYGNKADELDGKRTTLDDGNTDINARNYKSTIITESNIKGVMQGNNADKWHLYMNTGVDASIAVDDMAERLSIESLKYGTYNKEINMSAYSKPFKVQIEYTPADKQESQVDENGGTFEHDWSVFDFGIIERPREDIAINKSIARIKVTLANGQVLIDGDPRKDSINYVKAPGLAAGSDGKAVRQSPDRVLLMEIDNELIQGATLEVWYAITATNYSEIDYEYEADAKYYNYGDKSGLDIIRQSAELVADYMNPGLVCEVGDDAPSAQDIDNADWFKFNGTDLITAELLKDNGYISYKQEETDANQTYETLKENGHQILMTKVFANLEPNGGTKTSVIYASKLLANKEDEHLYDNHVEILQVNSKIGRTISGVEDGSRKQIAKVYQPGNYIPTIDSAREQDDDRVKIVITPPTGTTTYIITYVITGLVGLVAIVAVAIFIRKNFKRK